MSVTFGISHGTLDRMLAGWTHATRQWSECPGAASPTKAYESGVVTSLDLRLVDTCEPCIRLTADFWRRAIRNEHAA